MASEQTSAERAEYWTPVRLAKRMASLAEGCGTLSWRVMYEVAATELTALEQARTHSSEAHDALLVEQGLVTILRADNTRLATEVREKDAEIARLTSEVNAEAALWIKVNAELANARAQVTALREALWALTRDSRFALQIGGNPNAVAALVKQVDDALALAGDRP